MSEQNSKLNIDYVLEQIEKIAADKEYLYKVIEALNSLSNSGTPGDMTGSAKAGALSDVVKSREATNQQLLSTYTQMYLMLVEHAH